MYKAIVFSALMAVLACAQPEHQTWNYFKSTHQKSYASPAEEAKRKRIFENNMLLAQIYEKRNPLANFGATPYADMTQEEFKSYHNGEKHYARAVKESHAKDAPYDKEFSAEEIAAVPSAVDWRKKGAVTYVKNQGQCGSCWSFSTTGGIEGQWALAGNPLTALSEQEFVSCDTIDSGCQGGLMSNAYNWVLENRDGKLVTEKSYPYVSGDGYAPACDMKNRTFGAQIVGHHNIYHTEGQMKAWTAKNGPLSVAVAAGMTWQLYFGGVMTDCSTGQLDHGVLIVGYNASGATPYWIIKNSWGPGWGEQGYLYVGEGSNQCSVTEYPVSSIVGKLPPKPSEAPLKAGYFRHSIFDDSNCTIGKWDLVWEQNKCVEWDGVSFKASCTGGNVDVVAYYESKNCTGKTKALTEKENTCSTASSEDVYYTNSCPKAATPKMDKAAIEHLAKKALRK